MDERKALVIANCEAIQALERLNLSTGIDYNYEHSLFRTIVVRNQEELERITEEDVLKNAADIARAPLERKVNNNESWNRYFDSVNRVLIEHPFSQKEAKACGMSESEYYSIASECLLEIGLKRDEEEISCTIKYGVLGNPLQNKTFIFNEEKLMQALNIFAKNGVEKFEEETRQPEIELPLNEENGSTNSYEEDGSEEKADLDESSKNLKRLGETENIILYADESIGPVSDGFVIEDKHSRKVFYVAPDDPTYGEDILKILFSLDDGEQYFEETDIDDLSDDTEQTLGEVVEETEEERVTITSYVNRDKELIDLYPKFQKDKTIIGKIAKDLIIAKTK